ncbi:MULTISPECIES: gluconate 2-dehydrogenase subunit 3 family protein [Burkholderia]|uniref:Gluconate 2-dehydrogenase (Acceptor) n=1 Tax=Burkholderia lata (strain ATCC 17760 / DSM 23089 / LMG 22485 / NCIMB 9086 / R18194 / 383) TaxID=482957 RepID=A0A6P2JQD7_BURL3|nr:MULTISPECIES: gluconate 2-dehydrogenase subunit 3 family protein [Burkholderia]MBN3779645.1 gluconate 2-dehydrogenase subunit 3 family protein [Burkholderia sp. Ac-20345]VWB33763.1 gluconate 2-dehydrogenase (acceptor) [Burkholderia lata]VWB44464.1 gluconate 2-dehydrogenase (acceptor) [Burkholderia lata]
MSEAPPSEYRHPSASGRRIFLKRVAIVPAAVAIGACHSGDDASPSPAAAQNANGAVGLDNYRPKYFTLDEWNFVLAAADLLIPHDDEGPGALDLNVPVFIDKQLETGYGYAAHWYMQGPFRAGSPLFGYQSRLTPREVYRAGIKAVNARCMDEFAGKRFADLPVAEQTSVLMRLESGAMAFDDISSTDFFAFLLENTREGYLSDPIHGGNKEMGSWKMIGFPGARADFLDWVGTGKRYPFGPVGIEGQQG